MSTVTSGTTSATEARREGRVVAIAGPVIDVEFPPEHIPEINTALEIEYLTPTGENEIIATRGSMSKRRTAFAVRRAISASSLRASLMDIMYKSYYCWIFESSSRTAITSPLPALHWSAIR